MSALNVLIVSFAGSGGSRPSTLAFTSLCRRGDMVSQFLVGDPLSGDVAEHRAEAPAVVVLALIEAERALGARRCLVPADAFYEWKAVPDGKQPYAIARTDGAPLAFAGLWEGWRSPEGETLRTFTIVTTAANDDIARLHDRMPAILEEDDWPGWLGEADGDAAPVELLRPAAAGVVRMWPVSRAVNSVTEDDLAKSVVWS